jgi:hypothetical protein
MARFTPLLGDIRGKIAGNVFSANKSGAIIRFKKIPTNPKTPAQVQARNIVTSLSQMWKTIATNLQGGWGGYGADGFVPKSKPPTGKTSGFQAFMGVSAAALNFNLASINCNYYNGSSVMVGGTSVNIQMSTTAPANPLQSGIVWDGGVAVAPLQMTAIQINGAGKWTAQMQMVGIPDTSVSSTQLIDSLGRSFGIAIYISNKLPCLGAVPKRPFLNSLGCAKGMTGSAGITFAQKHTFSVQNTSAFNAAYYKNWINVGDFVRASCFQVGLSGELRFLNSIDTTITA